MVLAFKFSAKVMLTISRSLYNSSGCEKSISLKLLKKKDSEKFYSLLEIRKKISITTEKI
jgi:hypothetical protein